MNGSIRLAFAYLAGRMEVYPHILSAERACNEFLEGMKDLPGWVFSGFIEDLVVDTDVRKEYGVLTSTVRTTSGPFEFPAECDPLPDPSTLPRPEFDPKGYFHLYVTYAKGKIDMYPDRDFALKALDEKIKEHGEDLVEAGWAFVGYVNKVAYLTDFVPIADHLYFCEGTPKLQEYH